MKKRGATHIKKSRTSVHAKTSFLFFHLLFRTSSSVIEIAAHIRGCLQHSVFCAVCQTFVDVLSEEYAQRKLTYDKEGVHTQESALLVFTGIKLLGIHLSLPPKCRDWRHVP